MRSRIGRGTSVRHVPGSARQTRSVLLRLGRIPGSVLRAGAGQGGESGAVLRILQGGLTGCGTVFWGLDSAVGPASYLCGTEAGRGGAAVWLIGAAFWSCGTEKCGCLTRHWRGMGPVGQVASLWDAREGCRTGFWPVRRLERTKKGFLPVQACFLGVQIYGFWKARGRMQRRPNSYAGCASSQAVRSVWPRSRAKSAAVLPWSLFLLKSAP